MADRLVKVILRGDVAGLRSSMTAASRSVSDAAREMDRTGAASGRMSRNIGSSSVRAVSALRSIGVTAATLGLGKVIKDSIELEATYSKTMAQIGVATNAPKAQLRDLDKLAVKLGASTVFSAKETADAMLELAKGGLTAAQIKAGALSETLTLATAGGLSLDDAGRAVVNTMGAFGLKAGQSSQAVNALAGAANATSADVSDMTQALQQSGTSAHAVGLSVQETTALLASFANAGIKGSDAGTSLRTMLTRLVPQTKSAKKEMEHLGLSFVDANGQFVSATEIAQRLQDKLGKLTPAARAQAIQTIFGSDAQRAANILVSEGADGIRKYEKATSDQTQAQKLSKAAMGGTAGALEQLRGAAETAELQFGKGLAPVVQDLANDLSNFIAHHDVEAWGRHAGEGVRAFVDDAKPFVESTLPLMADGLRTAGDLAHDLAPAVHDIANAFGSLPDSVKEMAAAAGGALYLKNKLGGGLIGRGATAALGSSLTSKAAPVPVFVTNLPGGGLGGAAGAARGAAGSAGVAGALSSGLGAIGAVGGFAIGGFGLASGLANAKRNRSLGGDASAELIAAAGADKAAAATKRWNEQQAALGHLLLGPALPTHLRNLKALPEDVRTKVETPGAVQSAADVADLTKKYHLTPKQVRTVVEASGVGRAHSAVAELGHLYGLTPKQVRTLVTQAGMNDSQAQVRRLSRLYDLTPKQVRTLITADGGSALAEIARIRAEIASIPRSVRTVAYVIRANAAGVRSSGGRDGDPSTPYATGGYTGDFPRQRPVGVVHGGEFVFDATSTARAGVDNLYALQRSLRGYAAGGHVDHLTRSEFSSAAHSFDLYGGQTAKQISNEFYAFAHSIRTHGGHLSKAFDGLEKRAKHLEVRFDSASAAVDREKKQRDDLISSRENLVSTVSSGLTSNPFDKIGSASVWMSPADRAALGSGSILGTLRTDIANAGQYRDLVRSLTKRHVSGLALGAAEEQGLPALQALAGLSGSDLRSYQALFNQRAALVSQVSAQAGGTAYNALIATSNHHLSQLVAQNRELSRRIQHLERVVEATAGKTGHAVGKEINKAAAHGARHAKGHHG